MPAWLDSWTDTRYLNQQSLAKRWALRGQPEVEEAPRPPAPPVVLPIAHSQYILKNGKKSYRAWIEAGCPDREAASVCPALAAIVDFFVCERYPYLKRWRSRGFIVDEGSKWSIQRKL